MSQSHVAGITVQRFKDTVLYCFLWDCHTICGAILLDLMRPICNCFIVYFVHITVALDIFNTQQRSQIQHNQTLLLYLLLTESQHAPKQRATL